MATTTAPTEVNPSEAPPAPAPAGPRLTPSQRLKRIYMRTPDAVVTAAGIGVSILIAFAILYFAVLKPSGMAK